MRPERRAARTAATLFLLALSSAGSAASQVTVTDDMDRQVTFASRPCRIVSLIPAVTEIIFALGAEACLAGRSMYDDYPAGVQEVPDVGQAIGADLERVIAREPDLVVLVAGSDNARSVEHFTRLGVRTLIFRLNRISELRSTIDRLGRVLDLPAAADSLWESIAGELLEVQRLAGARDTPAVYYEIAFPPPITIGAGSYLDSLLVIAGARNVFGDIDAPSPNVSLESIVVRDPDLILYPVSRSWGGSGRPTERPLWQALGAVARGDVREVDADLVHRLGPRLGTAARHLAEAIHPDLSGNDP